jgi:hypothetical protein
MHEMKPPLPGLTVPATDGKSSGGLGLIGIGARVSHLGGTILG